MPHFLDELDLTPNRIEQARAAMSPGSYVDLTSSNPTRQGFIFPAGVLQESADAYLRSRIYTPDPRGNLHAREAVADYCNSRSSRPITTPENVFLTASTSEAYNLLFGLLCSPGDNVLAPDVGYPLFEMFAAMHHIELRPYRLDPHDRWRIDPGSVAEARDKRTRAMLIVSPHNPTGAVVEDLSAVPPGLPIIVDEVFAEFGMRRELVPFLGAKSDTPLFTLNGISKMFALPDLKLGWVAMNPAAAAAYAARFELINDAILGANALSQHLLPTLFERGMPFVIAMREQIRSNIRFTLEKLNAHPGVRVEEPEAGYNLFPEVETALDDESLTLQLLDAGVFVHPGHFYNCEGSPPRIMISCLTKRNVLEVGLDRICNALH